MYTVCIHSVYILYVLLLLINYMLRVWPTCMGSIYTIYVTSILTCALNLNLAGSCLSLSPSTRTTSTTSACLESIPCRPHRALAYSYYICMSKGVYMY